MSGISPETSLLRDLDQPSGASSWPLAMTRRRPASLSGTAMRTIVVSTQCGCLLFPHPDHLRRAHGIEADEGVRLR